jgi:hypothetical protein
MFRIGTPTFEENAIGYFTRQEALFKEENLRNGNNFSHIDCYDFNYFVHLPSSEFISEIRNEKILLIDVKYPQYNVLRTSSVVKIFNIEQQLMDKIDEFNFYDLNQILTFIKGKEEFNNIRLQLFNKIEIDQKKGYPKKYTFNVTDFIKRVTFRYFIIEFSRTKFGPEGHTPVNGGVYLKNAAQGLYFQRFLKTIFDENIFTTYSDPYDGDKDSARKSFDYNDVFKIKKTLEAQIQVIEKFNNYAYWRDVLEQISEERDSG